MKRKRLPLTARATMYARPKTERAMDASHEMKFGEVREIIAAAYRTGYRLAQRDAKKAKSP